MSLIRYQDVGSHRVEQHQESVYGNYVYPVYIDGMVCPFTFDQAIEHLQPTQNKPQEKEDGT